MPQAIAPMNDGDSTYLKIQADRDAYERGLADLQAHPEKVQALLAAKAPKPDATVGMQSPKSPAEAEAQRKAVEGGGTDTGQGALTQAIHDTGKKVGLAAGLSPADAESFGNAANNVVSVGMLASQAFGLADSIAADKAAATAAEGVKTAAPAETAAAETGKVPALSQTEPNTPTEPASTAASSPTVEGTGAAAEASSPAEVAAPTPVTAYHGSPHKFDAFDESKIGSTTDAGSLGKGIYLTTDKTAFKPTDQRYTVAAQLENPLRVSLPDFKTPKENVVRDALDLPKSATPEEVTAAAKAKGHDGIILDYSPTGYPHQEIVAFSSKALNITARDVPSPKTAQGGKWVPTIPLSADATPVPQSLGAAAIKDYSTPVAASQTLAQKQADVISQLRMGEKGAERFGRPDLATKIPASETMAEGRALGLKPEDVFSQPPKPSQVAAESSALIDVLNNEGMEIHAGAADLQARAAAGEDVTQAKQEWFNRFQAYAMQAPKPIARGSDVARAEQLFDPRRVAIQRISQLGRLAQDVPEGAIDDAILKASKLTDQQLAASAYMAGRVAERNGGNWFDAILQGYKFGLIFNPKTVIRNVMSNSMTQVTEIWARWLAGRLPGSQVPADEAALMIEGWSGGVKDALRLAKASAESGRPEFDIATEAKLAGTDAVQVPHIQYLDGPAISGDAFGLKGTSVGSAIDYIGSKVEKGYAYTLMAPDQFYKATGSSMQMAALAGRQANEMTAGLTGEARAIARAKALRDILANPSADLIAQSRDYADFTTFQNNLDRAWTKTISNVTNDWPLLQVVMPFRRTPLNIVEYGLDWLPLPVVNRNWRVALQAGPEGDIARAKIATGSAISAVIAGMYLQGRIKGEGAQNPELKKIQRDRGIQPNSFKVGDTWVRFPEPLAVPMSLVATGAELMDHVDDDLTKSQIGMAVALATAKAFTSAPALTGLSQMFEAMDGINNDDPNKAANFLYQEGAGLVPVSSLLRQINRASDPEYKETYSLLQKIGSNIPGSPFSQFPVRDYSGAAVHGQPGIIHNMLSPIDYSKETPDPVDDELLKVGVKIPQVPRYIFGNAAKIMQAPNDPAIGIELTPEQRDKWAIYRGEGIKPQLKTVMDSDAYKSADVFGKRILLGQIFSVHGAIARARILGEFKDLLPKYAILEQKRAEHFDAMPVETEAAP